MRGDVIGPEGLLGRFREDLRKGNVSLTEDPLDSEYDAAKKKLLRKHNFGRVPSLVTLTKTAAEIADETLEQLIKEIVPVESTADVAVLVGVQVRCVASAAQPTDRNPLPHNTSLAVAAGNAFRAAAIAVASSGPLEKDYIYTHAFYSIVNNQKMEHKPEMESVYEKSLAPIQSKSFDRWNVVMGNFG